MESYRSSPWYTRDQEADALLEPLHVGAGARTSATAGGSAIGLIVFRCGGSSRGAPAIRMIAPWSSRTRRARKLDIGRVCGGPRARPQAAAPATQNARKAPQSGAPSRTHPTPAIQTK